MLTLPDLLQSPLFVIGGPCVIESADQCLKIAKHVKGVCDRLGFVYVFKGSFDKANRSSNASFRGPGLEDGLVVLKKVKEELGLPVLTDIHEPEQALEASAVVDILQVPAFLARQTDLLHAVGRTGRIVNIKKGQFMAPAEMGNAIEKVRESARNRAVELEDEADERRSEAAKQKKGDGKKSNRKSQVASRKSAAARNPASNILITERGTFFGYNRLVNDFTGLAIMKALGVPVVFDVSHSTQQPAALGGASGGNPQYSSLLARAAVATGAVNGLFLECHPDPKKAKSDAATVLKLDAVEPLLIGCRKIIDALA